MVNCLHCGSNDLCRMRFKQYCSLVYRGLLDGCVMSFTFAVTLLLFNIVIVPIVFLYWFSTKHCNNCDGVNWSLFGLFRVYSSPD